MIKLRPYQDKAVEAVLEAWKTCRSCIVVLPTGCGKTIVFAEIARRICEQTAPHLADKPPAEDPEANRHVMIIAHRAELIWQARDKVIANTGLTAQVEMADFHVDTLPMPSVIVSTVQTQCAGRLTEFLPDDFGCLVIDEAHHAPAQTYVDCIGHYLKNPDCRLLGVTATPDRADEKALGRIFETVAYSYSVSEAIEDGWLVPVRQSFVKVDSLDYTNVSTTAGDLNLGELSEVLEEERNLHGIAIPTIKICGQKRAIIFATSVNQAERLAEIINRYEENGQHHTAEFVCGKTPKIDRELILERFRKGETQFVVNVGVLTEGFDDAGVEVVVMARPTKSRALYAQMAGRATRPHGSIAARLGELESGPERRALIAASPKSSCLIIDFVGNSGRHKLVTTLDILGGKDEDEDELEAREIVRKRCEQSEKPLDTAEELLKAREEVKKRKEEMLRRKAEEAARRQRITATASFVQIAVDAFNRFDMPVPEPEAGADLLASHRLSRDQANILREKLRLDPEQISYNHARAILDEYFRRIDSDQCSLAQQNLLKHYGMPAPMHFLEAKRALSRATAFNPYYRRPSWRRRRWH